MSSGTRSKASGESTAPIPRVHAVDTARGVALVGMIVFHVARDLEMFGVLAAGTTLFGPWAVFARLVAGSFLFLAGVGLVLGHCDGVRWRAFGRRLAVIAGAAIVVSASTYLVAPSVFIYFGVLHAIAASSLLALAFLGAPAWVPAASGAAVLLAHGAVPPIFATPWLGWTGLSAQVRPSLDFLPLIPWLGPCLLGVAAGRIFPWHALSGVGPTSRLDAMLGWMGRRSLAIYLLHQPILLSGLWLLLVFPAR